MCVPNLVIVGQTVWAKVWDLKNGGSTAPVGIETSLKVSETCPTTAWRPGPLKKKKKSRGPGHVIKTWLRRPCMELTAHVADVQGRSDGDRPKNPKNSPPKKKTVYLTKILCGSPVTQDRFHMIGLCSHVGHLT